MPSEREVTTVWCGEISCNIPYSIRLPSDKMHGVINARAAVFLCPCYGTCCCRTSTGRFASKVNGMIRAVQGSLRGGFQQQAGNHKVHREQHRDRIRVYANAIESFVRNHH